MDEKVEISKYTLDQIKQLLENYTANASRCFNVNFKQLNEVQIELQKVLTQ